MLSVHDLTMFICVTFMASDNPHLCMIRSESHLSINTKIVSFVLDYGGFRSRFLCLFKRCHRYAKCKIQNNTAVCVCPKACPENFSPVCGTNWKTYNNFCELARASCVANSRLRRRYSGSCEYLLLRRVP